MSIKKAAIINAASKYIKIILQLIFTAILSRILTPEDYGIVAVITVFTTFFSTFSDMGFGTAVIQNKDLSDNDVNNIYSFTVYISFGLAVIFFVFSFGISAFYNNQVYTALGMLLSLSVLFNALNMVPNAILMRDKKFISVAIRTVVVCIVANVVTVGFACAGMRYYALAVQSILIAFATYLWNYFTTRPKFRIRFDNNSVKKVLSFSMFQFGFNLINYFSRNLDNLLTGKFLGDAELGYYNKAYTLMLYPVNNLSGVISPVLHPILSDYQKQIDVLYKKFIKVISLLALLGIFVAPYCWLASEELITIMFGPQWGPSVQCFKFLSIAICTQMMNPCAGAAFQSLGKTKLLFINSIINTFITVVAILIGLLGFGSIETLALCVSIAYLFHFFTAYGMLIIFGFRRSFGSFLLEFRMEFLILIVLVIATMVYPFSFTNMFISAIVKLGYLGLIYLFFLVITQKINIYKSLFFNHKKNN